VVKPGVVLDAEERAGPHCRGRIDRAERGDRGAVLHRTGESIVRPGAVIRGGTTIGSGVQGGRRDGGQRSFTGYSNKQHDGFVGHSYVAQWVNLGADTVTSDLKNTYGGDPRESSTAWASRRGSGFMGSLIGDHAKTGIGTILPTGCVIGVDGEHLYAGGVPKFVPSFSWLTHDQGMEPCRVDKALQIARTW
jgi:NDP-sugar pyrophosphorylase family protein